jgi:aspartyl/asparaginyl beta-hydroxylase (cupin superfamily)
VARGHTDAPAWTTTGIVPARPLKIAERALMGILALIERLNVRCAPLGNPGVYANTDFPWVPRIEAEWRMIREELDCVLARRSALPRIQDITADAGSITRDAGWKIFLFTAYGVRSRPSIARCPQTWRILQAIPGLKTAMFSVFEPGKHLPAHRGPFNGVLRLHLGLIVPEPAEKAGIRIDEQVRGWQEGRVLIFDDAHEHEAWNHTESLRVVLFVDFVKPLCFPASLLNRAILFLARFSPYLRDGTQNLRKWETSFYDQDLNIAETRTCEGRRRDQ